MPATAYTQQLIEKKQYIKTLFAGLATPEWALFESPEQHYRMRAEFRVWHEGEEMFYAMFTRGQKAGGGSLIRCDQFAPACAAINDLMPRMLAAADKAPVLKTRWYAVEFLATLSGEMLVTMIYHKKLDDEWRAAAEALQAQLGVWIIGRSRGQKVVLAQDFVTEKLNVGGETFCYRQIEGSFTQPNAEVCEKNAGLGLRLRRRFGRRHARALLRQRQFHLAAGAQIPARVGHGSVENFRERGFVEY